MHRHLVLFHTWSFWGDVVKRIDGYFGGTKSQGQALEKSGQSGGRVGCPLRALVPSPDS